MAVPHIYQYHHLPVLFGHIAMADGGQNPLSSELSDSTTSVQASGSNHEPSFTDYQARSDQRNMEFAPLPTNHFGHVGIAQSPFDMRHMSNVLLDYPQQYHQSQHQPHVTQATSVDPTFTYLPFPSQQFANHLANQYQSQYPQTLASQYRGMTGYSTNTTGSVSDMRGSSGLVYPQRHSSYSASMSQQPHYPNFPGQQPTPYGSAAVSPYQTRSGMAYQVPRPQAENIQMALGSRNPAQYPEALRRNSGSESSLQTSSALRGPPRKPKQSGHALWVGNLPPGTQITDLKDHFSREAADDIESVFLISKSNCAFVNYKSVETCAAAMTRFHDSRFRGVRLVCRLRRGSNIAASPASATAAPESSRSAISVEMMSEMRSPTSPLVVPFESSSTTSRSSPGNVVKEKFFIVKSLTVEDLERSVSSGIWATQAHNEENLNAAFECAEHVYLIFSANKSGEYFGYARMESQINADLLPATELEKPEISSAAPLPSGAATVPVTIPTPATSTAPRGHIVDDSARGTIFWEAEHDNVASGTGTEGVSAESGETSGDESGQKEVMPQSTTFGKPFKISWQSTERLPFYRTRGLRNPWNANREVKIARDGTELEPTVGRKLIGMFEQQAQINAMARSGGPPPQYGGYVQQMPQYVGGGMMPQMGQMPQMPYGYGPQGPSQSYGRPY